MPRPKRSEKVGVTEVKPALAPTEAVEAAERILGAKCPICGKTIIEKRAVKVAGVTVGKVGYFDNIEWREDYPFGISFAAGGRGSLRDWHYIGPEDAPELFEAVKARFIQALKEWINKGWLSPDEISQL